MRKAVVRSIDNKLPLRMAFVSVILVLISVGGVSAATLDVPGFYPTIQAAINAANPGDTINVSAGNYTENVDVNVSVNLVGEGKDITGVVGAATDHVFNISASWVNISGFNISGATNSGKAGIYVDGANNTGITDSLIFENRNGIYLSNSSNNNISSVNASNNNYAGVRLYNSDNNLILNSVTDAQTSYFGVYLDSSSGNRIIGLNASLNGGAGIHVRWTGSNHNWIEGCNITGNPSYGVEVHGDNTTIMDSTINGNGDWGYPGIYFEAENNTIVGNTINSNGQDGIFINFDSPNNLIQNNTLMYNNYSGINVNDLNQSIKDNIISNNTLRGIDVNVGNQTIINNSISLNKEYGIYVHTGNNGSLIYNNLFNNSVNFRLSPSESTWNTTLTPASNILGGSNIGGNVWVHPNGTGFSHDCSDAGGDDICDSAYTLDSNNVDYLPLKVLTDTTPPSVTINSPTNTTYATSTIQINVTAADGTGVAWVKAEVDGTTNLTLNYSGGYYINTTTLVDGNHSIRIYAQDTLGYLNSDEMVYFTIFTGTYAVTNCTNITLPGSYHLNNSIPYGGATYCIDINASDVIFDGAGFTISGNDTSSSYGVYAHGTVSSPISNVTVRNVTVTDWYYGVRYAYVENNSGVRDVIASSSRGGIYLDGSNEVTVADSYSHNHTQYGIKLYDSTSCNLTGNNATDNENGIYFEGNTWNNTLRNNRMSNNTYNFWMEWDGTSNPTNDIDTSNKLDGETLYYLVDDSSTVIDGSSNAGAVFCINCDNLTIKNSVLSMNSHGVFLYNTNNSRIMDSGISSTKFGVYLSNSSNNTLHNNTVSGSEDAITLYKHSNNNTITNNTITNNTCSGNTGKGIGIGVELGEGGGGDTTSSGNVLYYNDLSGAYDSTNNDTWYENTTLFVGNRYGDYTGEDNNSDGIGDTPYNISGGGGAQDIYPLIPYPTTPPVISNIQNSTPTNDSVTITWATDKTSDSRIFYSTFNNLSQGNWSEWDNGTLSPAITLENMSGNTTYYYSAYSHSSYNYSLYSNSSVRNFTTRRNAVIWVVDDNGLDCPDANFTNITYAINAAFDHSTIHDTILVCNGTYVENLVLDRTVNMTGIDWPVIDGNHSNDTVQLKSDGNIVQGFNITNGSDVGLRVGYTLNQKDYRSTDNIIRNNNIYNNSHGVYLVRDWLSSGSNRNLITGNRFYSNALIIAASQYNNVTDNIFDGYWGYVSILGNSLGEIGPVTYNRVENNTFTNDYQDIYPRIRVAGGVVLGQVMANNNSIIGNRLNGFGGIDVSTSQGTAIINNTVTGDTGMKLSGDVGIDIRYSNDTYVYNNTVKDMDIGIEIAVDGNGDYTNTTMRNNTMDANNYNFYFRERDSVLPPFNHFDHDIDTSNTINGLSMYYVRHAMDQVYNSSSMGFFACINCTNITVNGVNLRSNSHGVLLYNTNDSLVNGTLMEYNAVAGVALYGSSGINITNSNIKETNESSDGAGVLLLGSHNNTLWSNNISGNYYGLWISGVQSNDNSIFNNYFQNNINAYDLYSINQWNASKTSGTNIIGGPNLGGNYWHDYGGSDLYEGDGIGDDQVPYNSSDNIVTGGDYLPLTNVVPDNTPPIILLYSPVNGTTYPTNYVYLKVSSPDGDADKWWYAINNGGNVTFTPNTTISGLSNSQYNLIIYVNDTSGNENSTRVNFTISYSPPPAGGGGGGTLPKEEPLEEVPRDQMDFQLSITSPREKSYTNRSLVLTYESEVPLTRASYILDGGSPVTVSTPSMDPIPRLTLGTHTLVFNGEDFYDMKARDEVTFTIMPLTFGEEGPHGTPDYPDEVAFSFMGRPTDYILTFEARDIGASEADVYLNRNLNGTAGDNTIVDHLVGGRLIGTLAPSSNWGTYEFNISGEDTVPGSENIIAFIHRNNPSRTGGFQTWQIRNAVLRPVQPPGGFPYMEVFATSNALSAGEETHIGINIEGITGPDEFDAYVYVLGPDGSVSYYPHWGDDPIPLDSQYIDNNYYGRLPGVFDLPGGSPSGTYTLVAKLTDKGGSGPYIPVH